MIHLISRILFQMKQSMIVSSMLPYPCFANAIKFVDSLLDNHHDNITEVSRLKSLHKKLIENERRKRALYIIFYKKK